MIAHQVLLDARPCRADIMGEALTLQEHFARSAPSHLVADPTATGLAPATTRDIHTPWSRLAQCILHASVADARMQSFAEALPGTLVLRYHGTGRQPDDLSRRSADAIASSLEMLGRLRPRVARAVASTADAARELAGVGYTAITVVPTITDCARAVRCTLSLDREFPLDQDFPVARSDTRPMVLFAGQFTPERRVETLLGAFHVLTTYLRPEVHMVLAGMGGDAAWVAMLRRFIRELALPSVQLVEHATWRQLLACYRRADLFMDAGGTDPLSAAVVLALGSHVPVIAGPGQTLSTMLGDAAVVVPGISPATAAEAAEAVLAASALSATLRDRGRRRAAGLDARVTLPAFLRVLDDAA